MSKSYKAASSAGAVALVLSGSVLAAAPAFDAWTVSNGTISGGACATGFSCGTAMSDTGFFQRMVTETATGQQYFQTIITENNANAANPAALDALIFADESYVRTGNVVGLADKQRISEVSGTVSFKASTTLSSGWAGNSLKLTQSLIDTSDTFQTDFIFRQEGNATNTTDITAKGMKITAYVPIQGTDKQDFVLVDLSGDYARVVSNSPSAGKSGVTIPGTPAKVMTWTNDTVKGNGGVIGDRVQAVWIGQDLSTIVGQMFGFTSYDNKTTAANDFISTFSLSAMPAVAWDTAVWGNQITKGTISDPFQPWP